MTVILYCSPSSAALKGRRSSPAHTTHGFCPSTQRILPLGHCSPRRNTTGFSGISPWGKKWETNTRQCCLMSCHKGTRINSVAYLGGKGCGSLALVDLLREPRHMHIHSIKSCFFSLPRNAIFLWVLINYWTYERFDPRQFTSHTQVNT